MMMRRTSSLEHMSKLLKEELARSVDMSIRPQYNYGESGIQIQDVSLRFKIWRQFKWDTQQTRRKTYSESDIVSRIVDRHSEAVEIVRDDVNPHQLVPS